MRILLLSFTAAIAAAQVPVFIPPTTFISNGSSVTGPSTYWTAAADFNRDGRLDLAAADNRVSSNMLGFVVALSQPGGGYSAPVAFPVGLYVSNLRAADFNNDGKADLLLTGASGTAIVFGNGNGTFSGPRYVAIPVGSPAGGNCTSADLNKDGNEDILVPGSGGLGVALGNGDGTFRTPALYATANSVYVMTGDFNNDGNTDAIATINSLTPANVFLGNGDGTLRQPLPTIAIPFGAQAGDFNNDGKLDLIMQTAQARQDGSNFAFTVALGNGSGGFISYSSYVFAQRFNGLVVADFNADGKLDVAAYMTSNSSLQVFKGRGDGTFGGILYQSVVTNGPFSVVGADLDQNGSTDLVLSNYALYNVFRNTTGNPPLLAQLQFDRPSVTGGAVHPTGTVSLGGPAPAGGMRVTLASSSPSAFFPAGTTVTIPAGATSSTFGITTTAVAAATTSEITATLGDVVQTAQLELVPSFTLESLAISPATQYANLTSTGVVTLSGPAASNTTVSLTSANPALASVPASVAVPAGSLTATYPIAVKAVTANSAVTVTATYEGVSKTAVINVLTAADRVAISKAIYTAKNAQVKVEATSTSATATLTVYNASTGAQIGVLDNNGSGKYDGTLSVLFSGSNPAITLKSSLGGTVTVSV